MPDDMPPPDHRTLLACDYMLINPLQIAMESWADLPATPLIPRGYEAQPELFPRLIALSKLSNDQRVALLDRKHAWESEEDTPWISTLLIAPIPEERIHRYLCSLMQLRLPDGTQGLLRYFDPRVSRHLAWLLSDTQLDAWLGPIECWCWRNPDQRWKSVERHTRATSTLRFTPTQHETLQRIGEINLVLAKLARTAPDMLLGDPNMRLIDALLAQAWQTHHLRHRADRILFAEQGMRFGASIHRHPTLAGHLRRAGEDTCTYEVACVELRSDELQRMAREIHTLKD